MSMHGREGVNMQSAKCISEFGGHIVSTRGHLNIGWSGESWKCWSPCSKAPGTSLQTRDIAEWPFCCPLPPLPSANCLPPS